MKFKLGDIVYTKLKVKRGMAIREPDDEGKLFIETPLSRDGGLFHPYELYTEEEGIKKLKELKGLI